MEATDTATKREVLELRRTTLHLNAEVLRLREQALLDREAAARRLAALEERVNVGGCSAGDLTTH